MIVDKNLSRHFVIASASFQVKSRDQRNSPVSNEVVARRSDHVLLVNRLPASFAFPIWKPVRAMLLTPPAPRATPNAFAQAHAPNEPRPFRGR